MSDKYCINCRYCILAQPHGSPKCDAPQSWSAETVSLVTGAKLRRQEYEYCETQRRHSGANLCGPSGQWFEPRDVKDAAE